MNQEAFIYSSKCRNNSGALSNSLVPVSGVLMGIRFYVKVHSFAIILFNRHINDTWLIQVSIFADRWRRKFHPVTSRVHSKSSVGRLQLMNVARPDPFTERTPIVVKEKLNFADPGNRYSEVFELLSSSTGPREWPCSDGLHYNCCSAGGESADCRYVHGTNWAKLCRDDNCAALKDFSHQRRKATCHQGGGDCGEESSFSTVAAATAAVATISTGPLAICSNPDVIVATGSETTVGIIVPAVVSSS